MHRPHNSANISRAGKSGRTPPVFVRFQRWPVIQCLCAFALRYLTCGQRALAVPRVFQMVSRRSILSSAQRSDEDFFPFCIYDSITKPQKYCTAMQLLFRSDIVFIYAFAVAQGPRNDNKGYERRQGVCRKLASPATRGTRKLSLRRIHAIQPLRAQRDSV